MILAQVSDTFRFGILFLVGVFVLIMIFPFGKAWLRARFSGAPVSLSNLLGMYLRSVNMALIVDMRISAIQAGISDLTTRDLELIYLVRRSPEDVRTCVATIIEAHRAGKPIAVNQVMRNHFGLGNDDRASAKNNDA